MEKETTEWHLLRSLHTPLASKIEILPVKNIIHIIVDGKDDEETGSITTLYGIADSLAKITFY